MLRPIFAFAAACGIAACSGAPDEYPVTCPGQGDYEYADVIVDAPGHVETPAAIDVPENAINGVVEGDPNGGGFDVYSRGVSNDPPNHTLTLRWSGRRVANGEGADLVVFENAFDTAGGTFMDPIVVEVSNDGETWVAFEHDYVAEDETRYSKAQADWPGFAGVSPVRWQSSECSDPFDPLAGGDRFDLDDLADAELRGGVRFLRLTTAAALENPDTGKPYPKDFVADGFDLDGVFARATLAD